MFDFSAEEVVYRSIDSLQLSATVYRPLGAGPFPAVVEVHGGAWIHGDRFKDKLLCEYLAASGIIVMALDFRQEPHIYPASIVDVHAGILWLKHHAVDLGGRPDWVGGLGASSGAHMLFLNALMPLSWSDNDRGPSQGDHDARLRMVVACWPIVDPHARYAMAQAKGLFKLVTAHETYWKPLDRMQVGNPQGILDDRRYDDLPPTLIIQGTCDANMHPDMITRFHRSYREAGGKIALRAFRGEPHDFILANPESPSAFKAMAAIRDFIICSVSR